MCTFGAGGAIGRRGWSLCKEAEHQTGKADFEHKRTFQSCQLRTKFSVFGSKWADIHPHSCP
ncbi:MAG: hypothetical protein E6R09_01175 [Rhodocyclaceae bacterium]|nr:MAG: hypothetical protein E6R09_01175 [Rhodocyclaceae bacterium]